MSGHDYSIALPSYQAVYIDIAKVASSSIKAYLAGVLEIETDTGNPHDIDFPRPPCPDRAGPRFYPGLYTFAFVRNPWDRLVSCYRDKIGGEAQGFTEFADNGVAFCLSGFDAFSANMSFTEFVHAVAAIPDEQADEHFRSQADYLTNSRGSLAVDFVGRYDNLANDLRRVVNQLDLPDDIALPRLQAAPSASYLDFYNPETQALIAQRYARDIALFAFSF
jgi:chondroitin 4-sulfotransferase 11